jgi:tetratricopeptide (TPR) repeat protein
MRKPYPPLTPSIAAPLLMLCTLCIAAPAAADTRSEAATAFQAGNFAVAVALFEQAIAEGHADNATRYNLAVAQFRQNDLASANANFRLLFEQGQRSPDVVYSLAVTEKLLGNTAAAQNYFALVANSNSSLADEAIAQLQALDTNIIAQAPVASALRTSLQLATGYNDAIVEVQDGKLTRNGDRYAETTGAIAWENPFGTRGLSLNVMLYDNSYADTAEQNFRMLGVGLQQRLPWFERRMFVTLDIDASQLDTQGFQQSANAGIGYERRYSASNWRLLYRYRVADSLNTSFDPFAGRHHRIQADYNVQPWQSHQASVRVSYEDIDRNTMANGESTLDLSRDLTRIDLAWAYQFAPTLQAMAGLSYGEMHARDYQSFAGGTRLQRNDDTTGFTLTLRKALTTRFMLQGSYQRNDNRSTLADFTYDQSIFEIGFAWTPQFP